MYVPYGVILFFLFIISRIFLLAKVFLVFKLQLFARTWLKICYVLIISGSKRHFSTGVEPIRCCHHGILSPARLPIPSRRRNYRLRIICNGSIISHKPQYYKYFFHHIFTFFEEISFPALSSSMYCNFYIYC